MTGGGAITPAVPRLCPGCPSRVTGERERLYPPAAFGSIGKRGSSRGGSAAPRSAVPLGWAAGARPGIFSLTLRPSPRVSSAAGRLSGSDGIGVMARSVDPAGARLRRSLGGRRGAHPPWAAADTSRCAREARAGIQRSLGRPQRDVVVDEQEDDQCEHDDAEDDRRDRALEPPVASPVPTLTVVVAHCARRLVHFGEGCSGADAAPGGAS